MSSVIFDFDGTLANSLPVVVDLFNQWFRKDDPIKPTEVEKLRNMTAKQVFMELNIPIWNVPLLLVRGRKELGKHIQDITLFDGISELVETLHKSKHNLYVVSSNSPENINQFLKTNNILKYFFGVQGNAGLFGKTAVLKNTIRKYGINLADCYYIADEIRDIEAAKKADIKSVSVTWGYNGQQILKEHEPDFIITTPADILKLIQ